MSGRPTVHPSRWVRLRTSVLDRVVGVVLALVLSPVIAVLAWRVRRDDGSPSMVGLDRVGRDGSTFRMWKLRSMRADQPDGAATGAVITAGDEDPRITAFGAVLRRWRLDELPQIWNVVRGDMGLLGPRPETPSLVDVDDPRWQGVLAVRPGISGPTQLVVEQWEAEVLASSSHEDTYRAVVLPVKLAVDAWYVGHGSLLTDIQVVCSMVQRFVFGRSDTWVDGVVRARVPAVRSIAEGAP